MKINLALANSMNLQIEGKKAKANTQNDVNYSEDYSVLVCLLLCKC